MKMKKKSSKRGASDLTNLYSDDDNNDYHFQPSDSDDAYTESEKKILDRARRVESEDNDSEEEVFGIHSDNEDYDNENSEEDDDNDNNMDSDIEGKEDDSLPNVRAWGKSKKTFYSTDYVDQDYGGFQGKDAQDADFEEQEARTIQHRLAQQLDEADFSLDFFIDEPIKGVDAPDKTQLHNKVQVKTDLSVLSKRQKLELLQKESPEFLNLIQDFNAQMKELIEKLDPILSLIKESKIPLSPATDFIKTRYHLILNYCTNILFYLLLKARKKQIQSHPIVRRLVQYRQLMQQLDPMWTDAVRLQCDTLLEKLNEGQIIKPKTAIAPRKSTNKLLKLLKLTTEIGEENHQQSNAEISTISDSKKPENRIGKSTTQLSGAKVSLLKEDHFDDLMDEDGHDNGDEEIVQGEKRGITYQIAKNKGLTPHRKKEQRNPRVKNRNKYRKALIRRKGQVRTARTEIERYGGEIFGIKARVKKGIKIKV